jgi:hypothetical protein
VLSEVAPHLCISLSVVIFCRVWASISTRAAWTRADRSGSHMLFRVPSSTPSAFMPFHQLLRSSECLSRSCQSPSAWDCPEFYCLVLFTTITAQEMGVRDMSRSCSATMTDPLPTLLAWWNQKRWCQVWVLILALLLVISESQHPHL